MLGNVSAGGGQASRAWTHQAANYRGGSPMRKGGALEIMNFRLVRETLLFGGVLALSGCTSVGEKALMHCFFFTPIVEASDADWNAFYRATEELPSKIEGLDRVWVGKLRKRPAVSQQVKLGREYGACMELADEAALETYAGHPAHDARVKIYEKVRVSGTTTFDILGQ